MIIYKPVHMKIYDVKLQRKSTIEKMHLEIHTSYKCTIRYMQAKYALNTEKYFLLLFLFDNKKNVANFD